MQEIKRNYQALLPGERRAFWMTLLLAIALSILANQLWAELVSPETILRVRIANSIPIWLGMVSFISAGLILSGKPQPGVWLVLSSATISLVMGVLLANGYGFAAASTVLAIALFLPTQVLKGRQASTAISIGFVAAILILVIDTFLPNTFVRLQITEEDVRTANILAGVLIVFVFIGLAFQYRGFPLRFKLAVAFIGLTAISVGLVSAQSIAINTRNLSTSIGGQVNRIAEEKAAILGNELNRLVNLLIIASNDTGLQQTIIANNQSYSSDRDIREQILELNLRWEKSYASERNDPLIYDRLTNPAALDLRVLTSRTQALGDLFVTDRYGALVGTMKVIRQFDYYNEEWWQKTYNSGRGGIYIGLPQYNDELQKVTMLIAVPVIDRVNNYIIGILGTVYPFDPLKTKINADLVLLGENAGANLIFPANPPRVLAESEVEMCQKKSKDLVELNIGSTALALVTSPNNAFIEDISQEQLPKIFYAANKWSEINPDYPDEPIVRIIPNLESSAADILVDKIFNGDPTSLVRIPNLITVENDEAQYQNLVDNPYAIGIAQLKNTNVNGLKIITVNGKDPNQTAIESGAYPLTQSLYLYTDKQTIVENQVAAGFLAYLLRRTNKGDETLGFFPASASIQALNEKKIAELTETSKTQNLPPDMISGNLVLGGSSAVYPIILNIAEQFKNEGFQGNLKVEDSDSRQAIEQFCNAGNVNIALASRKLTKTPSVLAEPYVTQALLLSESQKYFQMDYAGSNSLISIVEVNDIHHSDYIYDLGWKVVIYNPTKDALAPIEVQRRASIALLLAIGAFGTLAAFGLANLLSTPLLRLSAVAQKFGSGDLSVRAKSQTGDEIGTLASAFNSMADKIQQILADLEQQVAERTQAVVTSAEVSRRLSTILDQHQLLLSVVEEIQHAFNFYHAQIYLFDEEKQDLVMVGGTGEAGQKMMEQHHKIKRGKGLVGRAAETNSVVLVPETLASSEWLPNPLLPETKSEIAVPITIGDQVLGVLDVQHNLPNGFSEQTVGLMQSIANQVAIAIQNARLYSEAQKRAEREALILSISQKIQSEMTMEKVLEATARELGLALSLNKATVLLTTKKLEPKNNNR